MDADGDGDPMTDIAPPSSYEVHTHVLHPTQFAELREMVVYWRWREWRTTQPWYRRRGPMSPAGAGFLRALLPARKGVIGRKRATVRPRR